MRLGDRLLYTLWLVLYLAESAGFVPKQTCFQRCIK